MSNRIDTRYFLLGLAAGAALTGAACRREAAQTISAGRANHRSPSSSPALRAPLPLHQMAEVESALTGGDGKVLTDPPTLAPPGTAKPGGLLTGASPC